MRFLKKIISGGQTGTDRAALDVAIDHGIPRGGWCPKGRKAEDGRIPDRYLLLETDTGNYHERTRKNILDSDGTLILCPENEMDAGTQFTYQLCKEIKKPVYIADPADETQIPHVIKWLIIDNIHVLNIAGPRESNLKGIYEASGLFLDKFLKCCCEKNEPQRRREEVKGRRGE